MSSLVSKEKSEELGRWAHNAYLEALAETEANARKNGNTLSEAQIKAAKKKAKVK